ncbi:growth/differentiation factor 10 [Takifugu rubripes]|uniref:Growth differentiation factor 10b n=1 Tax=Takifugu rubripes TaxID=31033 RepID=H2V3T7_TAKRU|nr:growth/differentiation factor 10-like [Takifugu rubripes]|eukprot:XP_003961585.1 PREDICTED: bone morphogenetic protein 3B-like [Takifugu rubripes]
MASRIFYTTHLLLILECSLGRLLTEDLAQATDVPLAAEERVFTHDGATRDMVSVSMFKVYERYSKEPQRQSDGNTVRSFKAVPRVLRGKDVFQFNLSTIQDSELILFASFHFLYKWPRHHRRTSCFQKRLQQPPPDAPRLVFHGALGNVTLAPFKRGSWQTGDITAAVERAREVKDLVLTVEFDLGFRAKQKKDYVQADLPYILVYADDRAIDEPNSVALSLQRYGTLPVSEEALQSSSASRIRRELHHYQIQTNDIPEVPYNSLKTHELWQNTYFPTKAKVQAKGRRPGQEGPSKPQVLSFDERTMKKARRRQWSEPRACSRRYLRVDFADIGWSEWVLAPKSFDAYYCAGTCGFPIPKLVHPSNHATIQSIVRAVGIVPGIPEPCCVPEKMSPLSVLFLDPGRNLVLKVYPGMSVDTCACR